MENYDAEAKSALTVLLNRVGDEIHANKIAHGWKVTGPENWKDSYEVPAELMLITTEVAEAMEAFRHDDRGNFAEELADVMIRVIGLSHGLQIDLGAAIEAKMVKNRARAYQHGGKRI